jgi:hypothetical protein
LAAGRVINLYVPIYNGKIGESLEIQCEVMCTTVKFQWTV